MKNIANYAQAVESIFDTPIYTILERKGQYYKIVRGKEANSAQAADTLIFLSNDALSLAQDERIINATCQATREYGTSATSSVRISGRTALYPQLEKAISEFKGLAYSTLFLNAWMAFKALFEALCYRTIPYNNTHPQCNVLILADTLSHTCIHDALKFSKHTYQAAFREKNLTLTVQYYRYCDPESLSKRLARYYKENTHVVVVSDSVFSMDGTLFPLPTMLEKLSRYDAVTLVLDSAHATGTIGKTGRGLFQHFNIDIANIEQQGIDVVILSTFSKFGASCGAALSSNCKALHALLEKSLYQTNTASLTPPMLASAIAALQILTTHPEYVETLHKKVAYARQKLAEKGFKVLGTTNILPVIFSNDVQENHQFALLLFDRHKIWVCSVEHVATPRLRIVINRNHTYAEIDRLADAFADVRDILQQKKRLNQLASPTQSTTLEAS